MWWKLYSMDCRGRKFVDDNWGKLKQTSHGKCAPVPPSPPTNHTWKALGSHPPLWRTAGQQPPDQIRASVENSLPTTTKSNPRLCGEQPASQPQDQIRAFVENSLPTTTRSNPRLCGEQSANHHQIKSAPLWKTVCQQPPDQIRDSVENSLPTTTRSNSRLCGEQPANHHQSYSTANIDVFTELPVVVLNYFKKYRTKCITVSCYW